MFLAKCQDRPNSYWMDKKSFDQITANAAVTDIDKETRNAHLISNAKAMICGGCESKATCNGKCFNKPSAPVVIQNPAPEINETPLINAGALGIETSNKGKETEPLVMPGCAPAEN